MYQVALRVGLLLFGALLLVLEIRQSRRRETSHSPMRWFLGAYAAANVIFIAYVWSNHISFPLYLETMEGDVLQHLQRAVAFEPIYPKPSHEFVPLAYNPLYYVLAIPFAWVFGPTLFTLRLVSILGTLGSSLILYRVVQEKTRSAWWGLLAAGLFAAAYYVMGNYLDTAHSDSWLLFCALLGGYLIDRDRSRRWNLVGVMVLTAAFWFKQHGAVFLVSGVLFLAWREGLRRSWPYWLAAILLGPIAYIFAGPELFGPRFHYFTWEVPRRWSELNLAALYRYLAFILKSYPFLALSAALATVWIAFRERDRLDIWHFQFGAAALTGFMGALDPGSADNVFIPMGTWFILVGTLGFFRLSTKMGRPLRYRLHLMAILLSFVLLAYNPAAVIVSSGAGPSYADFITMLQKLEGNVYAPMLGQLQGGYEFYPGVHWVALEDMLRGPGRQVSDNPTTRRLLHPIFKCVGSGYILTNFPLEIDPVLGFLSDYYVLDTDFGDRFAPLTVLPGRYSAYLAWPRYLYRYAPGLAINQQEACHEQYHSRSERPITPHG